MSFLNQLKSQANALQNRQGLQQRGLEGHPEKNTLQALEFEYVTATRASLHVTPDHDSGVLAFRILNANGFGAVQKSCPAIDVNTALMDEIAKHLVGQPSRFE